jgi:hypothetical protein
MAAIARSPFRRSRRGVALVIVLAFVVLLTGVIIAYFTRAMDNRSLSSSSFNQAGSDELARSALDIVVSDVEQEIVNGSTPATGLNPTSTSPTIYIPTAAANMVPARNGTPPTPAGSPNPLPTLLRISAPPAALASSDTTLPPTYTQLASTGPAVDHPAFPNALSTTSSVNGRSVTLARWNQHFLLPCKTPSDSGADSTPLSTSDSTTTGFAAPRWVYVNSQGPITPASATAMPMGAIGRYAFAVYDESALLDVNVAGLPLGFPTAAGGNGEMSATEAQTAGKKGTVRFADLTQLPTATANTPLNATQVQNLIGWRNYASAQPAGSFGSFMFTGSPMDRYIAGALATPTPGSTPNAYLQVNPTIWNGGTDQAFLTRQQLLNFQKSSGGFSAVALQYLGTFSRALTAPTWMPSADSPNLTGYPAAGDPVLQGTTPVLYKTNAENTGVANRDLANLRIPSTFSGTTINHYNDDGTTTAETVSIGDPYIRHRFSLARINWLTHTGVAAGISANAVQDCFGLTWGVDGAANPHPCWVYTQGVSSSSGNGAKVIRTLDQVAALNPPREPNFFELLKAGILSGSLGKSPGKLLDYVGYNYGEGPGGSYFDVTSASPDMQILQIGANIIDQWDSDSYPTAIYFPGAVPGLPIFSTAPPGTTSPDAQPETAMANMVYGVENLPYLLGFFNLAWYTNKAQALVVPTPPTSPDQLGRIDAWMQPELWNPFQALNVTTNPAAANNRPTGFCVRAYGEVLFSWSAGGGDGTCTATASYEKYDTMPDGSSTEACVYFTDSNAISSFVNPSLLTQQNGGKYSASLGGPGDTAAINIALNDPTDGGRTSNQVSSNLFLAIHAGFANYGWTTDYTESATPQWKCYDGANDGFLDCSIEPYPNYINTTFGTENGGNPPGGVTFCMQYFDPSSNRFLPYSYMSRYLGFQGYDYRLLGPGNNPKQDSIYGAWEGQSFFGHADPLTDRFSSTFTDSSHGPVYTPWGWGPNTFNQTWEFYPTAGSNNPVGGVGGEFGGPRTAMGFKYFQDGASLFVSPPNTTSPTNPANPASPSWARGYYFGNWAQNNTAVDFDGGTGNQAVYAIYADADGVVRAGNDYLWNPAGNTSGLDQQNNPLGFANYDGMGQLKDGYSTTTGSGSAPTTTVGRRPLILNRPFRSVAEMGYAYRDLPFKSLDMFSPYSADSALLDLFCIQDEPTVIAGRVNPNNAPGPVIQALIGGANKEELDPTYIISNADNGKTTNEATLVSTNIATNLNAPVTAATATTPALPVILTNRADLVKLMDRRTGIPSAFVNSADRSDQTFVETPIRALSDVTNTRTWNLMIDVIAQSGLMAPGATTVNQFVTQGESRYWLHIAIDRFTGKIVDQQLEQVSE